MSDEYPRYRRAPYREELTAMQKRLLCLIVLLVSCCSALGLGSPEPHTAAEGVYCGDGCHKIKPKYGMPRKAKWSERKLKETEAAIHFK